MKANFILCLCAVAALVSLDCKSTDTTSPVVTVTCMPTNDVVVTSDSTSASVDSITYVYNASNQLVKILHIGRWDTLLYTGGKVTTREVHMAGTSSPGTYTYTYSGDTLVTMEEHPPGDPVTTLTTFTYSGGTISRVAVTGGHPGQAQTYSNIVFTGGNFTSVDFDPTGTGAAAMTIHITAVFDTHKKRARFVLPTSAGDFIEYFGTNNVVTATATNTVILGADTVKPGMKILDRAYTYDAQGEVSHVVQQPELFSTKTNTFTYYYDCK